MASSWPFGKDADEHDPLTALRIAVTERHPHHPYLVGFDRESGARPTDREATMLASYLTEYKVHWYGAQQDAGYWCTLSKRPLDVDGGANGVVFHKYGDNDWGYRRNSWHTPAGFSPESPQTREWAEVTIGPMTLEEVMDHAHKIVDHIDKRWLKWKADHPDVFNGS